MKRSQELIPLTRAHHAALELARRVIVASRAVPPARDLAAALTAISACATKSRAPT